MKGLNSRTAGTLLTRLESASGENRQHRRVFETQLRDQPLQIRLKGAVLQPGDDDKQTDEQDQGRPVDLFR